jgi:hypothetical protein
VIVRNTLFVVTLFHAEPAMALTQQAINSIGTGISFGACGGAIISTVIAAVVIDKPSVKMLMGTFGIGVSAFTTIYALYANFVSDTGLLTPLVALGFSVLYFGATIGLARYELSQRYRPSGELQVSWPLRRSRAKRTDFLQ